MRLVVDVPPGWEAAPAGEALRLVGPEGLTVEIPPLAPLPEDVWTWSRGAAGRDRPPGADEVTITLRDDRTSALGWPIAVYGSEARAAGRVVEARRHAVYAMIEHGTIVVVRAADPELLARHEAEVG